MTCATETRSPLSAAPREAGGARQHHAGLVMLALAMGGFAIGTTEFAVMSLLPYFSVGLGVDEPMAGHVISAYALGVVVGAPVIAVLAAKIPRRTLLIGLMAVFGVANLLSAMAPSYGWMLVFRFLSGLPHGAYFGVAALVAASIAPPNRRAQAVARVMLGLTVATIVGVPLANGIGQALGWRWGFGIVALLALVTMALIFAYAPRDRVVPGASPLRELGALRLRQVWLTLAIGAIGFVGMFAVYTYLASTLMEVTRVSPTLVPLVLAIFGLGLTAGTLAGAWAADRALMPSIGGMLLWTAAALALFPFAAGNLVAVCAVVFLIGTSGGLGAMLQTRLMDVAGEAQTLAAALNHSAFNMANALGPWLGGLAIAAGYGWTSTGWVGTFLALAGFLIWAVAMLDERARTAR
ncbi:MFS transporter [Bosea sp. (in: a-proteobacteria)]|uniref:MFS transporter n=1 Tax=Bosea sp. (in: a-proteobacteria) TaxID=1871050 RepID=UPI00273287E7|nr:MFS transporter [Bosea sp. (in: a-proteobacteria)]MDP3256057.1 MFS transporter [Bosea sp. (in: a-proteobacteria)]